VNPIAGAYRRGQEVGLPGVAGGDHRTRWQAQGVGIGLQMDPSPRGSLDGRTRNIAGKIGHGSAYALNQGVPESLRAAGPRGAGHPSRNGDIGANYLAQYGAAG